MIGRPSACGNCGTCPRCKHADYMREWYRRKTAEQGQPATGNRDPEVARRSDARRAGTEKRRASLFASSKRQRAANPEKYKARSAVGNALRDGRLIREDCEVCGNPKSEAHHDDYSKPLVVRWLCRPDHRAHHDALISLPF